MKILLSVLLFSFFRFHIYAEILIGSNSFTYTDGNKKFKVWYYNPNKNKNIPILFVMHGIKRNARDYRDEWVRYAKKNNFMLIVPEFSIQYFSGKEYITGNILKNKGSINSKSNWSFSIIEKIFHQVKSKENLKTEKYYLYGHSGGSQFVHRFVQFFPEASLELAISANAGWYTFLNKDINFPYGIKNLKMSKKDLDVIFSKKLIIMLGDEDTDIFHKSLRMTPESEAQGAHRFERGNNYFKYSKELANNLGSTFNWELIHVEDVGHSNRRIAKEAYKFIK